MTDLSDKSSEKNINRLMVKKPHPDVDLTFKKMLHITDTKVLILRNAKVVRFSY